MLLCASECVQHNMHHLIYTGTGSDEVEEAAAAAVQPPVQPSNKAGPAIATWQRHADTQGLEIVQHFPVTHLTWHSRGDYFASVAPSGDHLSVYDLN